jgi:hypothetical protein
MDKIKYELRFSQIPIRINKDTTPEHFYEEYLFGMNQHVIVDELEELYPGSLLLSEEQIKSYLSTILHTELPLTEELELDLHSAYDTKSKWYYYWYYSIIIRVIQLYKIPENKKQLHLAFIKYCHQYKN